MRRNREALIQQPKHAPVTRVRKIEPEVKSAADIVESVIPPATDGLMNEIESEIEAAPPESPLVAATVEQPLPLMMVGMTLWGMGITALILLPMATAALAATPLLFVNRLFFAPPTEI